MNAIGIVKALRAGVGMCLCVVLQAASLAADLQITPPSSRPITLVVGYAQGGSVDLVARALAPGLARRLGRPVRVENIAGASGALAAVRVALAEPDGTTLLLGSPAEVGINHLTRHRGIFNPLKDTTPIVLVGSQPMVLVASPRTPVATIDGLLAYNAGKPGATRYASSGVGTPLHLAGELINQRAAVSMQHVPYRGAGPILPDLISGHVDFAVLVLSSALPHIQAGRIKAIGLTEARRAAAAPDIPALAEHPRLAGVDLGVWFGLVGPARLPEALAAHLRSETRALLREPELRRTLQAAGLRLAEDTDFARFLQSEVTKFAQIVDLARLRAAR